MSDAPNRQIGGLSPRASAHDLSRMRRQNRTEPSARAPESGEEPAVAQTPPEPTARAEKLPRRKITSTTAPVDNASPARITTYLAASVRARAQAAFLATRHLEGDNSWSAFVERAILAETERRESEYNAGEPYKGRGTRLTAGRPLNGQ